jgi:hypothetical protein
LPLFDGHLVVSGVPFIYPHAAWSTASLTLSACNTALTSPHRGHRIPQGRINMLSCQPMAAGLLNDRCRGLQQIIPWSASSTTGVVSHNVDDVCDNELWDHRSAT